MTIDRARNSFDPTRDWRAVLPQQGRVTLEADINEQITIASESQRIEAIDVIGPVGTPDNGYVVTTSGADVQISAGTLYVGGWRLTLPAPISTASQPGWLDMPPWPAPSGNQIVALLVSEQSVVAVEDTALREVALGGPDSAGRLRLLQHVLRLPSTAASCADAATALPALLAAQGLTYDPATTALTNGATLQVTPVAPPSPGGPCDPPAQGGYLGADNQMIRVAIVTYDPGSGTGTLVWGWNNASFLHRAVYTQPNVVTLLADPLDPDHQPRQGQAVEILRCTMDFGDGDHSYAGGGNFVAAGAGVVMTQGAGAGQGYASATRQLTLPTALPTAYQNDAPRPLFVRLWEAEVTFTANTAVTLGDTGLAVTISMPDAAIANPIAAGSIGNPPFWQFAVRPSTPTQLYPQRYLTAPQPPEGPHQFLATLGVVGWNGNGLQLIEDCSVPFLPLTRLHDCSCCSMTLDPATDWRGKLNQAISDTAIASLNICFQPGIFKVSNPIVIKSKKSVRMTGAGAGTLLIGAELEVVLECDDCGQVGLADLSVRAGIAGYSNNAATAGLQGAVTLRSCGDITVERVALACAGADLRAASCLAIYLPAPVTNAAYVSNTPPPACNTLVLNSRFEVGHFQVGILLVNADRAQIEGNLIVTAPQSRGIGMENLASHKAVALRLRRQLIHGLTVLDTAPAATKQSRARLRKRQIKAAPAQQAGAQLVSTEMVSLNLGAAGRAHVRASFGTSRVQFISSDKLGNAWTDALRTTSLSANSTKGEIHQTILNLATAVVMKPHTVAPAFRNWLGALLPQLYSTSAQGIVVAGTVARDIRILDNTVDGTAQGIHVGLSDGKLAKRPPHLLATRVQIRGNTVRVRVTPETTGDRHGIFLGCVTSAVIADNHLELTRSPTAQSAGQNIDAIKIAGVFGSLMLIERNSMHGFSTGIYTAQDATSPPSGVLWKVAENASSSPHQITTSMFRTGDNIP